MPLRRAPLLAIVLLCTGCLNATSATEPAAQPPPSSHVAKQEPPPAPSPPPPSHCDDYQNAEAGRAHAANQHEFNHLDAQGYARRRLACVYSGGTDQWDALRQLWQRESGWGTMNGGTADIPQAKPRSKMGCRMYDHRCEIRWGLAYIAGRYGSPAVAWRAWNARSPHWY